MAGKTNQRNFIQELKFELSKSWDSFTNYFATILIDVRNYLRRLRKLSLDYVIITIDGPMPERAGPSRTRVQRLLPLPPEPLSIEELNQRFQAITDADNVKGVILIIRDLPDGAAKIENLRTSIERLKLAGKECVIYSPYLDTAHYFLAVAADRIIAPPMATFDVVGLQTEAIFLKDGLKILGIEAEVFQTSSFKGAYDSLTNADITPEQQEQLTWLLDENFDIITSAIMAGREMSRDQVLKLIDQAPFQAPKAIEADLIDDLAYEDELALILVPDSSGSNEMQENLDSDSEKGKRKAKLATWASAKKILFEKPKKRAEKYIGVISLEGTIVMGQSRRPPLRLPLPIPIFNSTLVGETTSTALLRRVERDPKLAALIVHIDSGGGSSLASDLIWRELDRISKDKPVLAYFGNVAASGGYYIGAAAKQIMAQKTTITGSIGVISLRLDLNGLYEKLSVNRVLLSRGKHASIYSDVNPLTEEERELFNQQIALIYQQFKKIVADGRQLPIESLDPICEGRIWTGRQAFNHKLIDGHGDFIDAIQAAAQMADIHVDEYHIVQAVNLFPRGHSFILPKPFVAPEEMNRWLLKDIAKDLLNKPLMLLPFSIKVH